MEEIDESEYEGHLELAHQKTYGAPSTPTESEKADLAVEGSYAKKRPGANVAVLEA